MIESLRQFDHTINIRNLLTAIEVFKTNEMFDRRLRNSDRKALLWYKQCTDTQLAALKGHPFYQDVPEKKKPC